MLLCFHSLSLFLSLSLVNFTCHFLFPLPKNSLLSITHLLSQTLLQDLLISISLLFLPAIYISPWLCVLSTFNSLLGSNSPPHYISQRRLAEHNFVLQKSAEQDDDAAAAIAAAAVVVDQYVFAASPRWRHESDDDGLLSKLTSQSNRFRGTFVDIYRFKSLFSLKRSVD